MNRSIGGRLLVTAAIFALAACSRADQEGSAPAAPSSESLASALAESRDFAVLEAMIQNAGLNDALNGTGPYTILAPPDDALRAASGDGDFADPALKAQAAALLRAHIVPGALTRADIQAAVERAGADGAQMRTMADGLLTFRGGADGLIVEGPDGASAVLTGSEALASNGVIQPISAALVTPPEAPTAG